MKSALAIHRLVQCGHTTMRAEPRNAKHAIDWRDRSPPAVARERRCGLTSKWHKPRPRLCPAPNVQRSVVWKTIGHQRIRAHIAGCARAVWNSNGLLPDGMSISDLENSRHGVEKFSQVREVNVRAHMIGAV